MGKIFLYRLLVGIWSVLLVPNMYDEETSKIEAVSVEVEAETLINEKERIVKGQLIEETEVFEGEKIIHRKPEVSEWPQIYKKWARISDEWKEIFENEENYPENLLKNLKRNPEILDFVYGYPDAPLTIQGGMDISEKIMKCPLFIQWDSRWGYVPYGSYNIGISGCGPTCLSMVLYSFLRDDSLTPDVLAQKAMDGGYYYAGQGTAWTYLVNVPQEYGLEVRQCSTLTETEMAEHLENGGLLICSMSPGDFTDTGHFIVVRRYKDGAFTVNDPFSYTNSYKTWDYTTLNSQIKQIWCYQYCKNGDDFTDGI